MCSRCRIAVAHMLTAVLADAPASIEKFYAGEFAKHRLTTDDPEAADALAFATKGITLLHDLGSTYLDRDSSHEDTINSVIDRLVANPETRADVPTLVAAAKFAHYAAILLSDLSGAISKAIDTRAADEYDKKAIDFAFSDVADEIGATRRALAGIGEDEDESGPRVVTMPVPKEVLEAVKRMARSGGGSGNPMGGFGRGEPKFEH